MKKITAASLLALWALGSSLSYADDRVINESLVYNDPTVAKGDSTISGVSIDQFFVSVSYPDSSSTTSNGDTHKYTNDKESTSVPSLSYWWGKGNWSVMASYRTGNRGGSYDYTYNNNAPIHVSTGGTRTETEVNVRYMLTQMQSEYFVPYALAGYAKFDMTDDMNIATYNITSTSKSENSLMVYGLGAIIPVSDKWGARFDLKSSPVNKTYTYSTKIGTTTYSGSGSASFNATRYTLTGYYNFTLEINLQGGIRREDVASFVTDFYYASLGYTFR